MKAQSLLPEGFGVLEQFVESWAVCGTAERDNRRSMSSAADRSAFYAAAKDAAAAALAHLDRKPLHALDDRERHLMNLLLSLCHVSLAVELQGDQEAMHERARCRMRIIRAAADDGPG